ncbi:MAG: Flp family type IVb pilin [Rhizobiaceae bacterium]|nr:Flp family type IVb pilin [Rhizobiaceae bacterium]MCV0408351.1 Flp family type IVb pilin [Rhizobiaceae bacterium]
MVRRFLKDEGGATAVEYGLIVAVLSLTIVAGARTAGNAIVFLFGSNESKLVNAFGY